MTQDARLTAGLKQLGLHVEPNLDTSAEKEYVAYFYDREGTLHGDDGPCVEYRRWTVVYVAPNGLNRLEKRQQISRLIQSLFGAWPTEENMTDESGQRYVYEFDTIGGIDDGSA